MTSAQHARWIRSGMQWQLARPLAALRDRLRRYGYTVYDIGDTGHMDHQPPEDHTPYSETGWSGTTPYGWVTAIDIMPPPAGLPSLQQLGGQLYADRQANTSGVAWLKYMNWEPQRDNGGPCYHDRWTPGHVRSSSGDRGHIHLSCRSDVTQSAAGDGYDPLARLRGAPLEEVEDLDMFFVAKDTNPKSSTFGQHFRCNGLVSVPLLDSAVSDAVYLAGQVGVARPDRPEEWAGGVRLGWNEAAFGALAKPATAVAVELADEQIDASVARVLGRSRLTVDPAP